MKKKSMILVVVACMIFGLTGCAPEKTINDTDVTGLGQYFVTISNEFCGKVIYDTRTGVEYWMSNGSYNHGTITPLIDADGRPLIYDGTK